MTIDELALFGVLFGVVSLAAYFVGYNQGHAAAFKVATKMINETFPGLK